MTKAREVTRQFYMEERGMLSNIFNTIGQKIPADKENSTPNTQVIIPYTRVSTVLLHMNSALVTYRAGRQWNRLSRLKCTRLHLLQVKNLAVYILYLRHM
jgi:hypothetical protein